MTIEELACWIADARRLTPGSFRWRATHDRALKALNETVEACAEIALAIDSGRGNEKEIARAIRQMIK